MLVTSCRVNLASILEKGFELYSAIFISIVNGLIDSYGHIVDYVRDANGHDIFVMGEMTGSMNRQLATRNP